MFTLACIVPVAILVLFSMWIFVADRQLREIEKLLERSLELQAKSLVVLTKIYQELVATPPTNEVHHFVITQIPNPEGDTTMPIQAPVIGIVAGATGTFLFTPVEADGTAIALPAGIIPTAVSSDPVNAPVVVAADGLSASITTLPTAPTGTTFTLTVSAVLADGTTPTGSTPVPFLAAGGVVAAFVITQTS